MEMTPGEIVDRYTILRMKAAQAPELFPELSKYSDEIVKLNIMRIWPFALILMEMNAKIWMLEADIRKGKEMPIEEVGKRALAIRDLNKNRVLAKAEIDKIFKVIPDVKVDHASQ